MSYSVINGKLQPIDDLRVCKKLNQNRNESSSFRDILNSEIINKESFVISAHAALRMKDRNIRFNEADMKRINEGINKAVDKGSKDCLILYNDVALVASIKNRTIITAVDKEASKNNVFTNIDSVILL